MNIAKLKLAELKKELKDRELPISGNKADLVARLSEAVHTQDPDAAQTDEDLAAKESELLGEEDDEDINTTELDAAKLLETSTHTSPPSVRPKKMVINRESAASAQQAATEAQALEAPAAGPVGAPAPASNGDACQPPAKKVKLATGVSSQAERLSLRANKFGGAADAVTNSGAATAVAPPTATTDGLKILTAEERKAKRASRFGADETTKGGASVAGNKEGAVGGDLDSLKKRAQRFGEVVSDKVKGLEEVERLKKRRERFGIVSAEDVKNKRSERFGTGSGITSVPPLDEKRAARAARFGLASV